MNKFLLLLSLIVFSSGVFAEINSQIHIYPEVNGYIQGDIVNIELEVYPIENLSIDEFKKIEGSTLYKALEVTQINSIEKSENNADVVIIKGLAVVIADPTGISSSIKYFGTDISLPAISFKFIPLKNKNKDYYILNQAGISAKQIWFWFLLPVCILIIFIGNKLNNKNKIKKELAEKKKKFNQLFQSASSRKDYEVIYNCKKEWLEVLTNETNAYREYFLVMENHQYKKEWNDEDINEVKNFFDIIRGSFL